MKEILDAFYKSGLAKEFFETLINDKSIPETLRRQIWTMMSTEWERKSEVITLAAEQFASSSSDVDLIDRWEFIVRLYWNYFPECPLKKQIDGRLVEVTR